MAHINTTLINKPTLGQITHYPSIYKNNCNNICIFQKKVVPLQSEFITLLINLKI